jgi:hypothetical protein
VTAPDARLTFWTRTTTITMSSSIELINPKAESVRRAAALQVHLGPLQFVNMLMVEVGEHCGRDGSRKRGEGQPG